MAQTEPLIRNISDTARWAALYRARESERPDALFHDPLARRLAGERGEQIAAAITFSNRHEWTWSTRTYLFDQFISDQVAQGVDMVINLAAGLDARPYRMRLPASLRWVEVDLPGILEYKEQILRGEKPVCSLERVPLDLGDVPTRQALFQRLGREATKALIISEGLLIYLSADEVAALARDLAAQPSFQRWVIDMASPRILRMLQRKMGGPLSAAGAPLKFGPAEGPAFFAPAGWTATDVRSLLKTAARLKRLPFFLRLMALLPDSRGRGSRPWSGIVLLSRSGGR